MICRNKSRDDLISIDFPMHQQCFNNAYKEFIVLESDEKYWLDHKRSIHLKRQPYIKEEITKALSKNPQSFWRDIDKQTVFWCCETMIRRWVTLKMGLKTYNEQIIHTTLDYIIDKEAPGLLKSLREQLRTWSG